MENSAPEVMISNDEERKVVSFLDSRILLTAQTTTKGSVNTRCTIWTRIFCANKWEKRI